MVSTKDASAMTSPHATLAIANEREQLQFMLFIFHEVILSRLRMMSCSESFADHVCSGFRTHSSLSGSLTVLSVDSSQL